MKTLQDFKDEVARENSYINWKDLKNQQDNLTNSYDYETDLAAERYAEYMAIEFNEWSEGSKEAYEFWKKNKSYPTMDGSHNKQNSKKRKELFNIFRQNKH